ncbi:MAG: hypothetical protein AB7N76_10820 [Planctomycetota bacterium]
MTLLELLVVVFLLSAVAASAISLADSTDAQARFDLTLSRREQIRTAILGSDRTANGQRVVSGFAADMGRLPLSVSELIEPPSADALWAADPTRIVGRGWRGPYLPTRIDNGRLVFSDGWGTSTAGNDYGWSFALASEAADPPTLLSVLNLASRGRDGQPGGVEAYDQDYPGVAAPLIRKRDWNTSVTVRPAAPITVTLRNDGTTTIVRYNVHLQLAVPEVDSLAVIWTAKIRSDPAIPSINLAPGASVDIPFALPSGTFDVASGLRVIEIVEVVGPTVTPIGQGPPITVQLDPGQSLVLDALPQLLNPTWRVDP